MRQPVSYLSRLAIFHPCLGIFAQHPTLTITAGYLDELLHFTIFLLAKSRLQLVLLNNVLEMHYGNYLPERCQASCALLFLAPTLSKSYAGRQGSISRIVIICAILFDKYKSLLGELQCIYCIFTLPLVNLASQ